MPQDEDFDFESALDEIEKLEQGKREDTQRPVASLVSTDPEPEITSTVEVETDDAEPEPPYSWGEGEALKRSDERSGAAPPPAAAAPAAPAAPPTPGASERQQKLLEELARLKAARTSQQNDQPRVIGWTADGQPILNVPPPQRAQTSTDPARERSRVHDAEPPENDEDVGDLPMTDHEARLHRRFLAQQNELQELRKQLAEAAPVVARLQQQEREQGREHFLRQLETTAAARHPDTFGKDAARRTDALNRLKLRVYEGESDLELAATEVALEMTREEEGRLRGYYAKKLGQQATAGAGPQAGGVPDRARPPGKRRELTAKDLDDDVVLESAFKELEGYTHFDFNKTSARK